MLCHSIYLQVVKVHVFNLGLPMNHSSRKPRRFRLLSICANAVHNVIYSHSRTSPRSDFFCKDIHETLKYVDEFSELKKMTKFKTNTSLSLSLLVDLSIHFDFPERMCMYQSLSLSLSIYICKNGLVPDQTRMEFRKECFVNQKCIHVR